MGARWDGGSVRAFCDACGWLGPVRKDFRIADVDDAEHRCPEPDDSHPGVAGEVLSFAEARRRVQQVTEGIEQQRAQVVEAESRAATCQCGDQWFRLVGNDGIPAAVTMSAEGSVTGFHGWPHCLTCGTEWAPRGGWHFA